jgi:Polyketide cyclase / dehydrase and lipid transport
LRPKSLPDEPRGAHPGGMVAITADVDIHATPREILDVLADLPHYPEWSAVHKRATVEDTYPDGRPKRATMAVRAAGLTDEQTLDYSWRRDGLDWTLVRSGQQRRQDGHYTVTKGPGGNSHVHYELQIDPTIPVPGFLAKLVMGKAATAATDGLKQRVEHP